MESEGERHGAGDRYGDRQPERDVRAAISVHPEGTDVTPPAPTAAGIEPTAATQETGPPGETPKDRRARTARCVWLYACVFLALAVVSYLIALGADNTGSVRVSWVFGSSSIPLVWLVLSAAVLGFTLGMLVSLFIRWRTRRRKKSPA